MSYDINRWLFEIPLEDIQENIPPIVPDSSCICCGDEIKKARYQVHLVNDSLVSTEEPFNKEEDQGFFPIGTSCKNKLPNNFYFKIY